MNAITNFECRLRPGPATAATATEVRPASRRRWYVFRSLARQEATAEANLDSQGFAHFLPKVLITKRHARRYVVHREWLFPRYGFVSFDVSRDRWISVNGTYGVERLVMGPHGPQPVPDGVIETLQACTDAAGLFATDPELQPGAPVRVTLGPFAGTCGVLQTLDGKGRVELLLELMNGQVRTKLSREWIEATA